MVEVYSFVSDMDSLIQKIQGVENKPALAIVKQTVECALFIQEYTANGFCSKRLSIEVTRSLNVGDRSRDSEYMDAGGQENK
jgi:hypothetical protein